MNHAAPVLYRRSNARFTVALSDTSRYEFALHIYRSGYTVVVFDYLFGNAILKGSNFTGGEHVYEIDG